MALLAEGIGGDFRHEEAKAEPQAFFVPSLIRLESTTSCSLPVQRISRQTPNRFLNNRLGHSIAHGYEKVSHPPYRGIGLAA
jgi:hypothetical protein